MIGLTEICILLGSAVPFILLPPWFGSPYSLIGQALVEEIMEYAENLQEDLDTNAIETREFLFNDKATVS